jgi:hypothetical protein
MYWRRRTDAHKRLMLIATINMVGPAMNRLGRDLDLEALLGVSRMDPAYLPGLVVLIGPRGLSRVIPDTAAWKAIASWLLA